MFKGLYVDRWRDGLRDQEQVDAMLSFAVECGITDLYVHNPRIDKSTAYYLAKAKEIDFDYIQYILNNFQGNVHLWFSLFKLWRTEGKLLGALDDSVKTEVSNGIEYINPNDEYSGDYLVEQLTECINRYPGIYGVHFEKIVYGNVNLFDFVNKLKEVASSKYLSANLRVIDPVYSGIEPIPLLMVGLNEGFENKLSLARQMGATKVCLTAYDHHIGDLAERISLLNGLDYIIFSYGACTDRSRLKEILNASN